MDPEVKAYLLEIDAATVSAPKKFSKVHCQEEAMLVTRRMKLDVGLTSHS
jgi:hypothetical protein